jgi:NADH-quinone oxidoreductase subunit B
MALKGGEFVFAKLDDVARWAQSSSVWPVTMGLACCAIEMMTATAPEYDLARLGSEVFRASPRQADLMIVSGRVARKMAPVVRRLWLQMADPKWVISMGACASSGGIFDNYAIVPVDQIVPVDVYIAGCPPTPDNLIYGINLIQQQIRNGGRGGVLVRS